MYQHESIRMTGSVYLHCLVCVLKIVKIVVSWLWRNVPIDTYTHYVYYIAPALFEVQHSDRLATSTDAVYCYTATV